MMNRLADTTRDLRGYIDGIRMVDTHEHLDTEEQFIGEPADFGRLFLHYASCDLISAGCPPQDVLRVQADGDLSPLEKWKLIEPYWEYVKGTGYGRCLETAIRDLYGLEGLSAGTVVALSEKMSRARRGLYYREVFDRAGIAVALWNRLDRLAPIPRMWSPDYDRSLFIQDLLAPFLRLDLQKLSGEHDYELEEWHQGWGREILCLDDYLGAVEERFCAYASQASALKIELAYTRPLAFVDRSRGEIEPVFNQLLNCGWERNVSLPSLEQLRAVQDYLVHFSIRQCAKYDLTVKFHTGLQEGNANTIGNARASLLSNLFFKYPKVRFDIYHISYPYQEELVTLVKNFANVAVDFCWMWIVNPAAGRRALGDFLDAVPANKIHGFGGDFIFIEGSYGHAVMAKDNIARVLAEKVVEGTFTEDRARQLARWILRDNPINWFGLTDKVPSEVLG
ncbi:MAG: amidohydrolase family protein [Spirochaetales bacterium]|nr:amidohydrolase family protein [Spirochaetales bacterium]